MGKSQCKEQHLPGVWCQTMEGAGSSPGGKHPPCCTLAKEDARAPHGMGRIQTPSPDQWKTLRSTVLAWHLPSHNPPTPSPSLSPPPADPLLPQSHVPITPPAHSHPAALQGFLTASRSRAVHLLTATANPTAPPQSTLRGRLGCRAHREEVRESRNRHPPGSAPENTFREGSSTQALLCSPSLDEAMEENLISPSHHCIPTPRGTPIRSFHSQPSAGPAIPHHLPPCRPRKRKDSALLNTRIIAETQGSRLRLDFCNLWLFH